MQSTLLHLDLPRATRDHPAVTRIQVTIAYESTDEIDLAAVLKLLTEDPRSKHYKRSKAQLGGMLLAERLREELTDLNKSSAKGA